MRFTGQRDRNGRGAVPRVQLYDRGRVDNGDHGDSSWNRCGQCLLLVYRCGQCLLLVYRCGQRLWIVVAPISTGHTYACSDDVACPF